MSSPYEIQNGVPQGEVFSVSLYLIAVKDITKCVHFPFSQRLFADDYNFSLQSADPLRAHSLIQITLDVISNWATTKGCQFSSYKTTLVIFKKKRNPTPSLPPLILQNFRIKTNDPIFLGLTFYRTSNWIYHIKGLKAKCPRFINVLKYLSHPSKGCNRKLLIHLYRILNRSRLDLSLIHISEPTRPY